MNTFEFAIESGFRFEFVTVEADTSAEARRKLWDEVLTVEQRDSASSIECVSETAQCEACPRLAACDCDEQGDFDLHMRGTQ